VAAFNYAVRLMEFPQGIFGISLATFLLPTLSGLAAEKDYPQFRATLREGMGHLIFLNLLAATVLLTVSEPTVRLLFQRGRFDPESTAQVSRALACLAPGLLAFSLVNIVARAFFALGDTTTPMRISVFCLAVNLVFTVIFLLGLGLGAAGLGVANSMSSTINLGLLLYALRRKLGRLELTEWFRSLSILPGAALLAGLVAWVAVHAWEVRLGHETLALRAGETFCPMVLAALVYAGVSLWGRVPAAVAIARLLSSSIGRAR